MLEQIGAGLISLEGTVVTATEQTRGKGLDKNVWESEPGMNLTFSVLLKPVFLKAEQQFYLNKVASLAVLDYVKQIIIKETVKIKWPNDVYIGNGKVAGILINNTISGNQLLYSVVGIGININQEKFTGIAANPVSLIHWTGNALDRNKCLEEMLRCLAERYGELSHGNLYKINSDYLSSLYRIHETHFFKYKNEIVYAKITGLSEFGHLQLTVEGNGKIECDLKEIEFKI
jgi:BirA family biotin operon repressor/biotin-[acetyl-CoA-carboxylase] ligase